MKTLRIRALGFQNLTAIACSMCLAFLPMSSAPAQAQVHAAPIASKPAPPANPHDLSGKWNRVSRFQTYGAVKGGANEYQNEILAAMNEKRPPDLTADKGLKYNEPVFTPAGKAAFDKNIPGYGLRITEQRFGNDPQASCDPWGVPRMLNGQVAGPHSTWEIVQERNRILWLVPWHHEYRMVWMDGRELPSLDELDPTWNGYSVGHWEGNTLVVNSVGFNDKTWLDHNGYPHTDQMKLQERYRLLDADTLEMTETIVDPEYYAQPFASDVKIWKRDKAGAMKWDEQIYCVPSEEGRFNHLLRDGQVGK
jgi:hypothetical protein